MPKLNPLAQQLAGKRIDGGRLELVSILGSGAYGVVYLAVDVKTGVRYAVKTLSKFNADGSPLDRRPSSIQEMALFS